VTTTRPAIPFCSDETKLTITSAQGVDQRRHVSIPLQTTKALDGLKDARGDPAQHHLAAPPALDVTSSDGAAASIFNSYRDIPKRRHKRVSRRSRTE
jgi:hypothetical protein